MTTSPLPLSPLPVSPVPASPRPGAGTSSTHPAGTRTPTEEIRAALVEAAESRRRQLRRLPPSSEPHDVVRAAHRRSVERILDQVTDALERLDAGSYGDCIDCAARLDPAELHERPWTSRCDWCAARV